MLGNFITKIISLFLGPKSTNIGINVFSTSKTMLSLSSPYTECFSLSPASFRLSATQPEQIADPFLYICDEVLFCFYEEKVHKMPGRIKVLKFCADNTIESRSCDLGMEDHVSFPFIYHDESQNDSIFMIPETASRREVALYRAVDFPEKWEKEHVFLNGNYVDSHLISKDNKYYLFTTEKIGQLTSQDYNYHLKIYISDTLRGEYKPHPQNPVIKGRKYSRSGGGIMNENGQLYRISQDCFDNYGKEINIFKIIKLSPTEYEEELHTDNWIFNKFGHGLGGHHVHTAIRENLIYIAVDFNYKDSYFQRFVKMISS